MSVLEPIFIGAVISIFLFLDLEWQRYIKRLLKIRGFKKPYDCFRCNMFWITMIVSLFYIEGLEGFIIINGVNYLTSYLFTK